VPVFKTLLILMRGGAARAAEEIADSNALLILDQQMRDSRAALERCKRALALAIAQDEMEGQRLATCNSQIADLEVRVKAALTGNNEQLAYEGAEAIADLEADRDAAMKARALFAAEIGRLRATVAKAEQRMLALHRGRRIARASEAARNLRRSPIASTHVYESTLSDAETTLARLRERQAEALAGEEALAQLDQATHPSTVAERLAAQGFGPRLQATAADVLARLRADHTQQST
jgi:phage shock protein A